MLHLVVLSLFKEVVFASNLTSSGRSHVGSLFNIEEQKKVDS